MVPNQASKLWCKNDKPLRGEGMVRMIVAITSRLRCLYCILRPSNLVNTTRLDSHLNLYSTLFTFFAFKWLITYTVKMSYCRYLQILSIFLCCHIKFQCNYQKRNHRFLQKIIPWAITVVCPEQQPPLSQ